MKSRQLKPLVNAFCAHRKRHVLASRPSFLHPPANSHLRHFTSSLKRPESAEPVEQQQQQTGTTESYFHLLPRACPGCGALTHNDPTNKAGYYGRKSIRKDIHHVEQERRKAEDPAVAEVIADEVEVIEPSHAGSEGHNSTVTASTIVTDQPVTLSNATCDRCHNLVNESLGQSISHPLIDSIAAIIEESPFQQNHVYHVIDAADFPASVIPNVFDKLELVKQRSQNRRAKSTLFKGGRNTTVSFIITRSDILCPSEEQVNTLMPWFITNLRSALGRHNSRARMGNVHLVSSKRGWWTKELKEDIRRRGGGNWMVGKVNVGKSNLFEVLYPKGSGQAEPDYELLHQEANVDLEQMSSALMPPAQPLVPFPTLPLVSSLPGTTASPIRLPFTASNGKRGELIDLPGLIRSPLEKFVKDGHQTSLVMTRRPKAEQITVKSTDSLLVGGGLMRISPYLEDHSAYRTDNLVYLMHPFLPSTVPIHKTSTMKAIEVQDGTRQLGIDSITSPNAFSEIRSAGIFTLDKDVTNTHAAKLLAGESRHDKKKVEDLPFRIYATDLVVEGVGWVEVTCQVRLPRHHHQHRDESTIHTSTTAPAPDSDPSTIPSELPSELTTFSPFTSPTKIPSFIPSSSNFSSNPDLDIPKPKIEVFTPLGKGVISRETMGVYHTIMGHAKQRRKGPEKNFSRKNRGRKG